jgi:hypothetical protein
MLRGIDVEHATAEHGDRPAARLDRPAMGGGVDAPRQSANDRISSAGEAGTELLGDLEPIGRGMPGADDGHRERVLRKECAANEEQAGRVVDSRQERRIRIPALEQDVDRPLSTEGDHVVGSGIVGECGQSRGELAADPANR